MTNPTHHDLLQVLHDAHAFYRSQVDRSWVPHHLNRRNLYPQMRPAGIGYAPPGWTTTVDRLRGMGYSDPMIEAAGLARTASTGNLIDVFRDRLMVPLTSSDRDVVGFIGRCSESAGDDVPKYLNSPQSAVFAKHDVLYALGEDAEALRRGGMPIIVEGPMDRLAIRQGGRNLAVTGVAPCGTALTQQQVTALIGVVGIRRPIAVALDPDPAGRAATIRAWELLTAAGSRNLLHVALPDGKDPAELIRNGRGQVLRDAITGHQPLAIAVADQRVVAAQPDPDNWMQRAAIARHVLRQDLQFVPPDQVGRYVAHLSRRLELNPETVTAEATDAIARGPLAPPSPTQSRGQGRASPALHRTSTITPATSRARAI